MSSSPSAGLLGRRPMLAISRTVNDRDDNDFVTKLVYFVDDDIRPLEQFACTFNKAGASHLRELRYRKPHDFLLDALDRLERSTRAILGDPCEDGVELIARGRLERYLHAPDERNRLKTSSAGIVFGLGSASRRRTSAACSSV